jgi:hypothetical protein
MTQRGLYDCAALRRDYAAAERGRPFDSYALWKALNVEIWLRGGKDCDLTIRERISIPVNL